MISNRNSINIVQGHQSGFTLVEILVTMIVMTIGFLGLAGLQATALRSNSGATLQTQAVIYINDMAERIRANPLGVADTVIPVPNHQFAAVDSTVNINCNALPAPYCEEYWDEGTNAVVPAQNCNSAQLAAFDINTWFCGGARDPADPTNRGPGINNQLGTQASVSITCNDNNAADADPCSPSSPHTIAINWRTRKADGSDFDALEGLGNCRDAGDATTDCQSIALAIQP